MSQRIVTETIHVRVKATEKEFNNIIFGNSLPTIATMGGRYINEIERYERDGYKIISKDDKEFSFIAEKTFIETTN